MIEVNGNTHFLCGLCRQMCGSGLYCALCGSCQRCIERRSTIQHPHLGTVTEPDRAERRCPRCARPYTDLGQSVQGYNDGKLMTVLQNLPLTLKMAEFQEDFGMMASLVRCLPIMSLITRSRCCFCRVNSAAFPGMNEQM